MAHYAARRQGSNHYLLQALAAFPAVVTRRLDCDPRADSPWHELGRALRSQDVAVELPFGARLELREFGETEILVDGSAVSRPRIAKSYELLAFLLARRPPVASRDELLTALFAGRSGSSARSYLRQAVHHLREVLPDGVRVDSNPARASLERSATLASDSARLEQLLAQVQREAHRLDLGTLGCCGRHLAGIAPSPQMPVAPGHHRRGPG